MREQWRASAFTGWQVKNTIEQFGASLSGEKEYKPQPFNDYLENLGLITEKEREQIKAHRELEKIHENIKNKDYEKRGLELAEKIKKRDNNRKGG